MYKILPLIGSVAFSLGINAQSVQRQFIGTMGSSYQGEEISVQQSVGQPYQTNSYYSNEVESRPGFIQPSQFAVEFVQSTFQIELDVYPNPSNGEFTIDVESTADIKSKIRITDIIGREVYRKVQKEASGNFSLNINLKKHPKGVYLLQLVTDRETINKRITIQ